MRQLPPLSALRAFDATARLGSVTRAAEELGRTHGAVSRQIRSLQAHLGAPLFDKAGAGLRLNAQGLALQPVVAEALDRRAGGVSATRPAAPACMWPAAPPSPPAGWPRAWPTSTAATRRSASASP